MKTIMSLILTSLIWSPAVRADQPAAHGMLLFGQEAVYASHLPMFHAPHDYQVILKLGLQDGKTLAAYEAAKKSFSGIFTLVPGVMDLSAVISGAKTEFSAEIFKGHFEQGGVSLGKLNVSVEQVIYSSKLNAQPSGEPSKYLVFGSGGEYFAAHLIDGKPNFDAILSVTHPYHVFVPHCRTRNCADPVTTPIADSQLPLTLDAFSADKPQAGETLGQSFGVLADVLKVIYMEEADLAD